VSKRLIYEEKRICDNCFYVRRFQPREDEIKRGLTLGCRFPNYEGYTRPGATCGFWRAAKVATGGEG